MHRPNIIGLACAADGLLGGRGLYCAGSVSVYQEWRDWRWTLWVVKDGGINVKNVYSHLKFLVHQS